MRALVHERYGPPEVVRVADVPQPVPGEDEVLVRVHATTINQTDCHMRRATPIFWRLMLGLRRPKRGILGSEFAGEVASVGSAVTAFQEGDRVFGIRSGAHAEYIPVRESAVIAHIPLGMTFEEAAAIGDSANQGLNALRAGRVRKGQRILVYGASGACGTACVQLAHHRGAHVTAVCNTKNVELVRSLGAGEVLDYTRGEFPRDAGRYDVFIDAVGKRRSFFQNRRFLKRRGVFVPTDGLRNFAIAPLTPLLGRKRIRTRVHQLSKHELLRVSQLIEQGHFRAVVDRVYSFEDAVEAYRYVESWQKAGTVVLTLKEPGREA